MNSEPWELLKTEELKKEIKILKKNQLIINKRLNTNNKLNKQIINILLENRNIYNTNHIENKIHTKNIRDMLEMFSDLKSSDSNINKSSPFTESRMHNRMWRHSIKNNNDIKDIKDNYLMGIYRDFNLK